MLTSDVGRVWPHKLLSRQLSAAAADAAGAADGAVHAAAAVQCVVELLRAPGRYNPLLLMLLETDT